MNIILIFPPMADPTQPYSSLPALAAFLRDRGWDQVVQMDLNIEFVRHVLTGKEMEKVAARIEKRLGGLDRRASLKNDRVEYALLVKASLKAPFVIEEIDSAVKDLQDPGCLRDLRRLSDSRRLVHEAMEIVSSTTFPLRLTFSNSTGPSFDTTAELMRWVQERGRNPYVEFFERDTLPRLKRRAPGAIGISVTYRSQVLAAVTLAELIKKQLPGVPVIFGGNIVSCWYDTLEVCPELFQWCDYLIPFEGESALHGLLTSLSGKLPVAGVPNLVYRSGGEIRKNPVMLEEIDSLPTPDYRGLPLDRYLAPEPVFILYTSRGCYWSGCHFCSISASMRVRYRARTAGLVRDDIARLKERHNARYIAFADDCVSPATLKALASELKTKGPEIYWQCEVRFEKALTEKLLMEMKDVGCLNLVFGLESYSPHVLSRMNKGIDPAQIDRIIGDCRRLGIAFNLQFFFGFPGEKLADAKKTVKFIRKEMHGAATFSFGTFELQRHSAVERNPGLFNIRAVDRTGGPLAIKYRYGPDLPHAQKIRDALRGELLRKIKYPYSSLSINAHTLIFLHGSGVAAMADLYAAGGGGATRTGNHWPHLMQRRLVRHERQTIGTFRHHPAQALSGHAESTAEKKGVVLLYDYAQDKIVEVSPLATWLLRGLDGSNTPSDLVNTLKRELAEEKAEGSSLEHITSTIRRVVKELYEKGLVVPL